MVIVTIGNVSGSCAGWKGSDCTLANGVINNLTRTVPTTGCIWQTTWLGVLHTLYCADGVWYYDINAANTCVRFTASPEANGCPPTMGWTADAGYSTCNVATATMSLSWD